MSSQSTSQVLMVRPASFGFNAQAAETNKFQNQVQHVSAEEVQQQALAEFDGLVRALRDNGVTVNVVNDSPEPRKPDAIFPNNWATYHGDGTVVLFPMCTENRRWERRRNILELLSKGYSIRNEVDLSHYEQDGKYLEGTGSMILDRENRLCYACLSERTHPEIVALFCQRMGYQPVTFYSFDENNFPVYHTNVIMALASKYVIICMESVTDAKEKAMLLEKFAQTGKEVVDITFAQVKEFAGNALELRNQQGQSLLAMSERAYKSFTPAQKAIIEKHSRIVYAPIYTIETIGGGGARCMIAEVFLPQS